MEAVAERPKAESKSLADRGDDCAAAYLNRKGYKIVDRSWKCAAGTADIVAIDSDSLVFVEVKTRSSAEFPNENNNAKKRERFEKIALSYLQDNEVSDITVRFDVISISVLGSDRCLIRHHVNAFSVGD